MGNLWFCKILLLFQVESKTDLGMKRHSSALVSVMEEYTGPQRPGERLIPLILLIFGFSYKYLLCLLRILILVILLTLLIILIVSFGQHGWINAT